MIKGILIDIGKTVVTNRSVDFKRGLKAVYDTAFEKEISFEKYFQNYCYLRTVTFDYARKTSSEIRITDIIDVLNKTGGLKTEKTSEELEDIFTEHVFEEEPVEGIFELLTYFKKRDIPIVAVSDSCLSSRALKKELDAFNLMSYFHDIISSADLLIRKPRPEIFSAGMDCLCRLKPLERREIAYIGNDYERDMKGAYRSGLVPIWFNQTRGEDTDHICKFNVSSYRELEKLLVKEESEGSK